MCVALMTIRSHKLTPSQADALRCRPSSHCGNARAGRVGTGPSPFYARASQFGSDPRRPAQRKRRHRSHRASHTLFGWLAYDSNASASEFNAPTCSITTLELRASACGASIASMWGRAMDAVPHGWAGLVRAIARACQKKSRGSSGNRTPDLLHPKQESYH